MTFSHKLITRLSYPNVMTRGALTVAFFTCHLKLKYQQMTSDLTTLPTVSTWSARLTSIMRNLWCQSYMLQWSVSRNLQTWYKCEHNRRSVDISRKCPRFVLRGIVKNLPKFTFRVLSPPAFTPILAILKNHAFWRIWGGCQGRFTLSLGPISSFSCSFQETFR